MDMYTPNQLYYSGNFLYDNICNLYNKLKRGPTQFFCPDCNTGLFKLKYIEPIVDEKPDVEGKIRYYIKTNCYVCNHLVTGRIKETTPCFSIVKLTWI